MTACKWYGSRVNNKKPRKLYVVFKSKICISHLLRLIKEPLWICEVINAQCAFLVIFKLEEIIIFVNSIKRIRARAILTHICNNLTALNGLQYVLL